jgi:multicomponent Na+:H+ antiporter subunit D
VFPSDFLSGQVPIATTILVLGLIGSIGGGVAAVLEKDLRRVLAYSSISQLGLIATGIGLSSPLAATAALFHIMAHSVMKASLFLVATNIRYRTAQVRIDRMAGIAGSMPWSLTAFAIAAVSMVGVPPPAGFFSKFYLVQAAFERGHWIVAAVVLGSSLLTATYMVRFIEHVYLRPLPPGDGPGVPDADRSAANAVRNAAEMPADAVAPAMILAVASLLLGIFNVSIISRILGPEILG